MSSDKTITFGIHKKTRFQKEKEKRESEKKKAAEEAAKVYDSFVVSFQADSDDEANFIKGSTLVPGKGEEVGEKDIYKMGKEKKKKQSEIDKMLEEIKSKQTRRTLRAILSEEEEANLNTEVSGSSKSKTAPKKREIDSFFEELKAKRETKAPNDVPPVIVPESALAKGSFDDGDPNTTNLYVGNLAPTVTEEILEEEFGKFGKIYSVKVMWPRTEEERARKRNCGFVSFVRREDAEIAKMHLHDIDLEGHRISVSWGKAIKKLPKVQPQYIVTKSSANGSDHDIEIQEENEFMHEQFDMKSFFEQQDIVQVEIEEKTEYIIEKVIPEIIPEPRSKWDVGLSETPIAREITSKDSKIEVQLPTDTRILKLINRLARYVVKDGAPFENSFREREALNPDYKFLYDLQCPEAYYYRWKVYSLIMGDKEDRWQEKSFQMTIDGVFWVPPKMDEKKKLEEEEKERKRKEKEKEEELERERLRKERYKFSTGRQLEKARERELGKEMKKLSDDEYNELTNLLQRITLSRFSIQEVMGFAFDNADASEEIVQTIFQSLCVRQTPIPVKVARLFLVSDILHNSNAPIRNASTYRTLFQDKLPEIFESLNEVYQSIGGRMTAKNMEERVMLVLNIWERWSLYPTLFITGLEATFHRTRADMENLELGEIDEDNLDYEELVRKARQAGLVCSGSPFQILKRLTYLNKFVKRKAAQILSFRGANTTVDGISLDQPSKSAISRSWKTISIDEHDSSKVDISSASEDTHSEDGDDIDGIPMNVGLLQSIGDDDDVDGTPISQLAINNQMATFASHKKALEGFRNDRSRADSDDDIDGTPINKNYLIDRNAGEFVEICVSKLSQYDKDKPIEDESDEEIDGIPLQNDFDSNNNKNNQDSQQKQSKIIGDGKKPELSKYFNDNDSSEEEQIQDVKMQRKASTFQENSSASKPGVTTVFDLDLVKNIFGTQELDDEKRKTLREIEARVLKLRDDLENRNEFSATEIDDLCSERRRQLLEEWERERKKEERKYNRRRSHSRSNSRSRGRSRSRSRNSKRHKNRSENRSRSKSWSRRSRSRSGSRSGNHLRTKRNRSNSRTHSKSRSPKQRRKSSRSESPNSSSSNSSPKRRRR